MSAMSFRFLQITLHRHHLSFRQHVMFWDVVVPILRGNTHYLDWRSITLHVKQPLNMTLTGKGYRTVSKLFTCI